MRTKNSSLKTKNYLIVKTLTNNYFLSSLLTRTYGDILFISINSKGITLFNAKYNHFTSTEFYVGGEVWLAQHDSGEFIGYHKKMLGSI